MGDVGGTLKVLGPVELAQRIGASVSRTSPGRFDVERCDGLDGSAAVWLLDVTTLGAARAISTVEEIERRGLGASIGVAPARPAKTREDLLAAGASDVVTPNTSARELSLRISTAAGRPGIISKLKTRDREIVLVTSLARRLVGLPDTDALMEDALAALGRSIGLVSAELRILGAPWRVDAEASIVVTWHESDGIERASRVPLDDLDLESLRSRSASHRSADGRAVTALPLIAQGQALAVLRTSTWEEGALDTASVRTLHVIGSLLAGAMEQEERVASLQGRSRNLEAQVAERARESAAQKILFQAVVDALPVSIHAIDRAYRVVVWNRTREAGPFGRPRGEVMGTSLFSVIGEDHDLRCEYEDVFRTGEARITELEGRASQPPRLYRVEKFPMRLGRGSEVTHVVTVSRDLTDQRALERSVARTEKMAAIGRLAAGIAHEINNPLATIVGCAEAMRGVLGGEISESDQKELGEDARVIEDEAYRCKDILGNLLDFSRSTAEQRSSCDLGEVARKTLALLRHNPKTDGVDVSTDLADDVGPVSASADQLVQVLLTLLINAADASGTGGSVVVRTRRGGEGEVVLEVEDDGPGIPPEIRERIFEPFFTTKPPGLGTGLGLSVAYGIVKAHGGRIEVVSEPNEGTRFLVIMPAEARVPAEVSHV